MPNFLWPVCQSNGENLQRRGFHQRQGFEACMALAQGSEAQKQMLQDAINRFWWPALMMFGPNDDNSPNSARSLAWKIKRFTNDELRQRFVDNTVPQVEMLGMTVPDPDLHFDTESGHYRFGEIDWQEFNEVINGRGICNQERLDAKRKAGKKVPGYGKQRWPMHKNNMPVRSHKEIQNE
ncbi:phenylacetate-CoA oxygenase subunit PaaA [Escherichia coli]|uniref:Phenylacetate-CoA oxygenase subunit PaaA n=1 Tax=Escherichia coli TaxID=562 RepID=A0A376ZZ65_ECOLX|nr:phenylacetate-CoA oxygenase subunit PaaA [Escherichia coli]